MAHKLGDQIVIKDIRNAADCPDELRMYSGQTARITKIISAQMYSTPNGNETAVYYELDIDNGKSLWPERYITSYTEARKAETENIDLLLKMIGEVETKLDTIKRVLWRQKRYSD